MILRLEKCIKVKLRYITPAPEKFWKNLDLRSENDIKVKLSYIAPEKFGQNLDLRL